MGPQIQANTALRAVEVASDNAATLSCTTGETSTVEGSTCGMGALGSSAPTPVVGSQIVSGVDLMSSASREAGEGAKPVNAVSPLGGGFCRLREGSIGTPL